MEVVSIGTSGPPPEWIFKEPTRVVEGDVYSSIKPRMSPYEHQRRAVNDAVTDITLHGFHALFMEMGTGKTKTTIDAWMVLIVKNVVDTLVVISPKSLMSTWTDEELPKHASIEYSVLAWDGKATLKSVRAFETFLESKKPKVYVVNVEAFQSLNEELRSRMSRLLRGSRCLMAVDECFAPGTEVDLIVRDGALTPTIKRARIEDVVPGDVVANAMGSGVVKSTAKREVFGAVIVKYNGASVTCSYNHPFLTHKGWIQARYLQPGDLLSSPEASMRLVRGHFHPKGQAEEWSSPKVLREIVLCEMENVSTRNKGKDIHKRDKGKNSGWHEELLQTASRFRPCEKEADRGAESHERGVVSQEVFGDPESHEASAKGQGRKWKRIDLAAVKDAIDSWIGMGCRTSYPYKKRAKLWISYLLQGGHSKQETDGSYRSRWIESLFKARPRPEEGCSLSFIRVDSVEVLEQTDNRLDRFRDAEGRLYFYDLEVSGHPSFCANGAVVHNSSTIKGADAKRSKHVAAAGKLARGRMILTGTEMSKSPLDLYMQFEFLKTGFWNTRSFFMFKNKYAILEDSYGAGGRTFKKIVGYQRLGELVSQIEPYTTRALKAQCLDLPEKVRTKILVDLTPVQERMYAQLKASLAAELESGELMTVPNKIALFTKFRQLTGGTMKGEDEYAVVEPRPGKLVALLDDIQDSDEQAIVWCAFRGEIQLVADALKAYGEVVTFDGSTEVDERSEAKVAFQEGRARFFVSNMKAGAYGLNLQNCHLQYFYSRDTSPQANWQAEDRSHRPGQKSVCVYKSLVVRGSVDERILDLIDQSADLRDIVRGMSAEDIVRFV